MKKTTCFLVDDIPEVLEMLALDLERLFPHLQVIGKAKSVVEAAKQIRQNPPDIVFLDIMLGDGTGFDLLEIYPNLPSKIIFVTASDQYAIKAFKYAAIDYVLKPYSDDDLQQAMEKAYNQLSPSLQQLELLQNTYNSSDTPTKISLHTQEKISVVSIVDIIRCEADSNYTTFYMEDGRRILVSKTLKYYADILKENGFLRVHQSHLINRLYIKEFIKSDGGYLLLKNKKTVPVSVRKRSEVIEAISRF